VSFSADIGGWLGDPVNAHRKSKAIGAFITGFWLLVVGNNVTQGPCRALLADLAELCFARNPSSPNDLPLMSGGCPLFIG
ncbi:hypothetical protein ZOSMA_9654G00010, partial [Zostera marina]